MNKENKAFSVRPAYRVGTVQEYYFSKKLKEVAAMNAAGKRVISLGIGSPDLPPSEVAIETFQREVARPDVHGYQPYTGMPELRRGYAAWYEQWYGVTLDADREVLPLIGSKEGILHISMAFLNPGEGVLVPNPGYPTYSSVSRLVGAELIPYTLEASRGWQPDFEALERLVAEREAALRPPIKLMWANYPNMPTGADASDELLERLVDFGRRHGIVICHDNPYSFILNDHPRSILAVKGAKEVCIELNSMSKAHNMPGWRMAMLASNAQFVEWILRVKSNVDSGQFRPMQSAVVEALKAPREWYDGMNAVYRRRRILAERIMDALGCQYDRKQVGLFLWGRVPTSAQSGEALADRVLQQAHVFITPGFIFGSAGDQYVRISLCCPEDALEEALERVKTKIEK